MISMRRGRGIRTERASFKFSLQRRHPTVRSAFVTAAVRVDKGTCAMRLYRSPHLAPLTSSPRTVKTFLV